MSEQENILAIATSQLGVVEGSNNNTPYGAWYGLNNQPWCMMFVSWCAAQAGVDTSTIPKQSYCPTAVNWFTSRGLFKSSAYTPKPGDIIFFDENQNGVSDHVGLVYEVDSSGKIVTIEGNRSDNVSTYRYSPSYKGILGYGTPNYQQGADEMEISEIVIKNTDSGKIIKTSGFLIEGRNYILLRDIEKLAPVVVDWDEANKTVTICANYHG